MCLKKHERGTDSCLYPARVFAHVVPHANAVYAVTQHEMAQLGDVKQALENSNKSVMHKHHATSPMGKQDAKKPISNIKPLVMNAAPSISKACSAPHKAANARAPASHTVPGLRFNTYYLSRVRETRFVPVPGESVTPRSRYGRWGHRTRNRRRCRRAG